METSTVEGKIISSIWRRLGDNDPDKRRHSESEMWLWLRDAVDEVAANAISFGPNAITADSDFVISPIPNSAEINLIKLCMVSRIIDEEYTAGRYDGMGIIFASGVDKIDTSVAAKEAGKLCLSASKEYKLALAKYNMAGMSPGYDYVYTVSTGNVVGHN